MSFLTGLYILGAAAITFPILFHLIRRTPQKRMSFSSLLFLTPSPPRLTRRSRLDHLLLLALRALAITLLTIAFMRPLFRPWSDAAAQDVRGRRVAILVDTSASMQRADLWKQALEITRLQLEDLEPADDVALFTFADRVTPIVAFGEDKQVDLDSKRSLVRDALTRITPGWAHTDLATALMTIAESLDVITDRTNVDAVPQIVLVSDMQEGARLHMLEGYQWPSDVNVHLQQVSPKRETTNASLRLLVDGESGEVLSTDTKDPGQDRQRQRFVRVRVENTRDSVADQFYARWADASGRTSDSEVAFHVPAGQSRVLRVPYPDAELTANRITLSGDDCLFDDEYYVVPLRQERFRITYFGDDDAMDPEGLQFYLKMALPETRRRRVDIVAVGGDARFAPMTGDLPRLVVVTKSLSPAQQRPVNEYLKQGGTLLAVLSDDKMLKSLDAALDGVTVADSGKGDDQQFALLGEINFEHPLFSPFAASGYNDFTMIRFWKHRHLRLSEDSTAQVLARFDNGYPAILMQSHGQGNVILFASGWNPRESQLARSWKFAVLLSEILEQAGGPRWQSPDFIVNQAVTLPVTPSTAGPVSVITPSGNTVELPGGASVFDKTTVPGIYRAVLQEGTHDFAVNVASSESKTTPLEVDRLETLGIPLGQHARRSTETERLRQLRDTELESKQQLWRWLILAALIVLVLETWLAGRYARLPQMARGEAT